jgi:AcrR family transcriptional regulator
VTTASRRGRVSPEAARQAVVHHAEAVLVERGFGGFTIDEVARRSRVSKTTIYKYWPNAYSLAVETYGERVTNAVPVRDTGDAIADLTGQIKRLAAYYASAEGRLAAQIIGASTSHVDGPQLLRQKFFAVRRSQTTELITRGVERGQLRDDLAPELMIDLLFGGIVFRMMNGMGPLNRREAADLARAAVRSVAADASAQRS